MPAAPASPVFGPAEFQRSTGIGASEMDRLARFASLLERWQAHINLVAAASLPELWRRHMLDSAQLLPLLPAGARTLVDLGSGAGFPDMVLALLTDLDVTLIESDGRKAIFLKEVSRETARPVTVVVRRIEQVPGRPADVVTARALAPLSRLLELARPFRHPGTVLLFPKGRDVARELTRLPEGERMRIEQVPSRSDPNGTILRIQGGNGD